MHSRSMVKLDWLRMFMFGPGYRKFHTRHTSQFYGSLPTTDSVPTVCGGVGIILLHYSSVNLNIALSLYFSILVLRYHG